MADPPGTDAPPSPAPKSAPIPDGDTANIIAIAVAAAAGVSDVRTDKVAAIQQALTGGTYAVSPSDVAEKPIDHLLQG